MLYAKLLTNHISQNAIANAIRTVLQVIIGFIGSYILVRSVSAAEFGAWALSLTFASFLGLVDLGIATAMIKYTAANPNNSNKIFWTSSYYYAISGFIAGFVIAILQYSMKHRLYRGYDPTFPFLLITVAGTYIGWLAANFNNILNGLQMMKRTSFIEVVKSLLFYICIIPLIPSLGLLAFPIGFLMSNLIGLGISFAMVRGKANLQYSPFDLATFKMLLSFGLKSYGMHLTALFKMSFIKIVTSQLFNLQYVAYVEMSQKIGSYIRQMYASVNSPLLPAASTYQAKGDTAKIRKMFMYSQSIITSIGILGTITYIVLAPFLVTAWLGTSYQAVITISVLECLSIFANMLLVPSFTIYQGMGRFKPILATFGITIICMLVLVPLGGYIGGFTGMYYGFILAEIIPTTAFFVWFIKKKLPF